MSVGVAHRYFAPQFIGTFSAIGPGLVGTRDLFVDDNNIKGPPLVAPFTANLRTLFVSFGVLTGSPTYDLLIYKNAVLDTTVALTIADEQAVKAIDIAVARGDEITAQLVNTHGDPDNNNFEDIVMELST